MLICLTDTVESTRLNRMGSSPFLATRKTWKMTRTDLVQPRRDLLRLNLSQVPWLMFLA